MNNLSMAKSLMGSQRSNPGQTTTSYGIATSDSEDGLVMVDMGGDTVSPDDDQSIECETTFKVYEGDEVIVSLIGADGSGKTPIVMGVVGRGDDEEEKVNALRARAVELQEDILRTATETLETSQSYSDDNRRVIESNYLSRSDYGIFAERIESEIAETAREIRESFNYEALASTVDNLEQYYEVLTGEIKRGFIEINGVKEFGIVISSTDVFKAAGGTYTPDGDQNVYYEISSGAGCFGLYTATGWQFWKGDEKLGWFDIRDGQLHVDNIKINYNLNTSNWGILDDGVNFGIKYIGA